MDTRPEQDPMPRDDERFERPGRRFETLAERSDATYPMLAPAAAVSLDHDEDAFDEQILAGLVDA